MRRGQTALEYVFLIGIVAAAIIAILVYISRGFQENLRFRADQVGEQYSPKNMRIDITQRSEVKRIDKLTNSESGTLSESSTHTDMIKTGTEEVVKSLEDEKWR